jgi:hypothetical protein
MKNGSQQALKDGLILQNNSRARDIYESQDSWRATSQEESTEA